MELGQHHRHHMCIEVKMSSVSLHLVKILAKCIRKLGGWRFLTRAACLALLISTIVGTALTKVMRCWRRWSFRAKQRAWLYRTFVVITRLVRIMHNVTFRYASSNVISGPARSEKPHFRFPANPLVHNQQIKTRETSSFLIADNYFLSSVRVLLSMWRALCLSSSLLPRQHLSSVQYDLSHYNYNFNFLHRQLPCNDSSSSFIVLIESQNYSPNGVLYYRFLALRSKICRSE